MPIDVKTLREKGPTPQTNDGHAQAILSFLATDPTKAFTFREIADGLIRVRGSEAILPWNPLLAGFRAFNLAAALEELRRTGLVVRSQDDGGALYYHLPERSRKGP